MAARATHAGHHGLAYPRRATLHHRAEPAPGLNYPGTLLSPERSVSHHLASLTQIPDEGLPVGHAEAGPVVVARQGHLSGVALHAGALVVVGGQARDPVRARLRAEA